MDSGLITKIMQWTTHPLNDNSTLVDWVAGLGVVLILVFFWTQVLRQIQ